MGKDPGDRQKSIEQSFQSGSCSNRTDPLSLFFLDLSGFLPSLLPSCYGGLVGENREHGADAPQRAYG